MKEALNFKKQKNKRIHALVSGKVQGVFFRDNTFKKAKKENLTGWVRNLKDGKVETEAEGDEINLERFVQFLRKGPINAQVEDVLFEEIPPKEEKAFLIK